MFSLHVQLLRFKSTANSNSHDNINRHTNSNHRLIHRPQPYIRLHRKATVHKPKLNLTSSSTTTSTIPESAGSSHGRRGWQFPTRHDRSVNSLPIQRNTYADYELRPYDRCPTFHSTAGTSTHATRIGNAGTRDSVYRSSVHASSTSVRLYKNSLTLAKSQPSQVFVVIVGALYEKIPAVQHIQ